MSIEESFPGNKDQRVNDVKQAWAGAQAEKPVRDMALEEGITEDEKALLTRLAERHGEKAMQEYAIEKAMEQHFREHPDDF